jgi:tRNA(Ile)-lysidine synthase
MINIQGDIPRSVGVAVSGGVDSMAVLDFLSRNHNIIAYYFDHGTDYGSKALDIVIDYCDGMNIPLQRGHLVNQRPPHMSMEEFWREERYAWFKTFDQTIVLCHHLDDCVETYVFNMCHGKMAHMPYRHANTIRPFRLNRKAELIKWAKKNDVPWLDDPSNDDNRYARNHIRNNLMPMVLKVNPGLHKVIKKKLSEQDV